MVAVAFAFPDDEPKFKFGSLFHYYNLPACDNDPEVLLAMGAPSSRVPYGDEHNLMEDNQNPFKVNYNSRTNPAGYHVFGQFVDHDITYDDRSIKELLDFHEGIKKVDPSELENHASPMFDLDTMYGPREDNEPVWSEEDPAKFQMGDKNEGWGEYDVRNVRDVPRDHQGNAIIPEDRNDENLLVNQMHAMFMSFHNAIVDLIHKNPHYKKMTVDEVRDLARSVTIAHYQRMIVDDFLPSIIEKDVLSDVFSHGRRLIPDEFAHNHIMSVEFSVAAFRFGHSQVMDTYTLNSMDKPHCCDKMELFPIHGDEGDRVLTGGRNVESFKNVEWDRFFYVPGYTRKTGVCGVPNKENECYEGLQYSRKVDERITMPMLLLPIGATALPDENIDPSGKLGKVMLVNDAPTVSLASLNLLRAYSLDLPCGKTAAKFVQAHIDGHVPVLNDDALLLHGGHFNQTLRGKNRWVPLEGKEAPLWFYLLREAKVTQDGEWNGPLSSRIIAETFYSLLENDKDSIFHNDFEAWIPTYQHGKVLISDMIRFLGFHNPKPCPHGDKPGWSCL